MKIKPKTRTRLLILLSLVVVTGGGAAGAYKYRKVKIERQFAAARVEGLSASASGDNRTAIDRLELFLRRYPTDEQALIAFIKCRQKVEDPQLRHLRDTITYSRRLLSINPNRVDERRGLMELYAKLDQRTEALDHAKILLGQMPGDPKALEVQAVMLIRLGRGSAEQRAAIAAWVARSPQNLDAQITLMQLRKREGETLQSVAADLQKSEVLDASRRTLLLAIACGLFGDAAGADKHLRAAATLPAPDETYSALLISQMRAMSLSDEADDLQERAALQATGVELRWQFACRLWEKRETAAVIELLKDVDPEKVDSDVNLLALRAMALKAAGRTGEVGPILAAVEKRDEAVAKAWATALRQSVRGESIDVRKFIEECKRALTKDPYNVFLLTFLGDAQLQQREVNPAIEAYERASGANMTWAMPPLRLAELLLSQGRYEQARDAAAVAWQRSKRSVIDPKTGQKSVRFSGEASILLARALGACEQVGLVTDSEKLLLLVEEIQQNAPAEPNTIDIYVRLLARRGKVVEAVKAVEAAISSEKPLPPASLLRLASTSRTAKLGLEDRCLAEYEKRYGVTPELAFSRALRLHAEGRSAEGRKLIEQNLGRADAKELLAWETTKARYLDLTGDAEAAAYWVVLGDKYPTSLEVQQSASASPRVVANREFMDRTLDRLSKLSGEASVGVLLARARVQVQSIRTADDAERVALELSKAVQSHRDLAEFRLLLAYALDRANKPDQAMEHLIAAASLQSSSPGIALEVARRLQARGDLARAKQYLARVGVDSLEDPFQLREVAVLLAEQGQVDKAISILESARGARPNAANDLTLAAMYRRERAFDKAERAWRDAVTRKPTLDGVLFGVSLFVSQNRAADAEAAMSMLEQLKLEPGVKELVWGDYFRQLRRYPEAGVKYREATKLDPKNAGAWQSAIAHELLFGKVEEVAATVEEAHRAVPGDAGMTAIHGRLGVLREVGDDARARSIASLFVADPIANAPAIDALAALSDARRRGDPLKYAKTVQEFSERFPRLLVAQVLLAEMHLELGRPEQATRVAQRVMSTFGNSEEAIYRCATVFEGAGAWEELLQAAKSWKSQFPASSRNADLAAARALVESGRISQAADVLAPYAATMSSSPDKEPIMIRLYLTALSAGGRVEAADRLAGELMKSPAGRSALVAAIGKQVPAASARRWLDGAGALESQGDGQGLLAVATGWSVLAARTNDASDKARARELLTQLSQRPGVKPEVVTGAAMALEAIKDSDLAAKFYQQALASGSNNPVAQNNLAMLLAAKGGQQDLEQAIHLASDAVKALPAQPALRDTLASVLARDKQLGPAVESMKEAVRLEPANVKWRTRLAGYLADSGEFEEARRQVDVVDALGASPSGGTPDVKDELSRLREKLRN